MLNTHTLFKELITVGFTEPQAEKLSEIAIDKNMDSLATKEQVKSIKDQVDALEKEQTDIKTDIKIIKNDIAGIKENIKENMATKRDLMDVKYDILKWIIPMFLGILLTILLK